MILSRTPYRVSFFGGGTDFPTWYRENGGAVLSTTINRFCHISCRCLPPFFAHRHRIVYSKIELVQSIDEIEHPAVRECLRLLDIEEGIEVHHDGDLPKRTGLGTSSSFAVGLLNVLHALGGEMTTPMQLAEEAIHVERDMCRDNVGSQDQVAAAHGGLNAIRFGRDDSITVDPVILSTDRLQAFQEHLLLFFTGFARTSSEVAAEHIRTIPDRTAELKTMASMVDDGLSILTGKDDLVEFGKLMHEGWKVKRSLNSRVTNDSIDGAYAAAKKAGAIGGKLCGAGGGGFLLIFAEPGKHDAVRKALKDLLHVPFALERSGSQIVFFESRTATW